MMIVAVRTKMRAALVLAVALVSLVIAGPACADGLLPTPAADAVTGAQTAVQATVGTATQPVTGTITPVLEQTQPVVDEVENVVPEPVRQVIGTVRGTVNQLPVPIATAAGEKPAATALPPNGRLVEPKPAPLVSSSPRSSEPTRSRSETMPRSTPKRLSVVPAKRATKPAAAKPVARRAAQAPSVVTTRPASASESPNVPILGRGDARRAPEARAGDEKTPAPVSPSRDRDSLVAAASSAAGGSDLGKTVGLAVLLGLFLTPILLNAIRAEVGPFREPFLRRRARPG
jgi:hypothetical protein